MSNNDIEANTVNILNYSGYKGNINLKKQNVIVEWTPEILQEYLKCSQDPIYFTEKYVKIISVDDGLVSFKLYDYQKNMMNSMTDNRYTILTTARQVGKCLSSNTKLRIRNKKTGKILDTTMGYLYNTALEANKKGK